MMIFQVFSIDLNCDSDITLNNYSLINNINITDDCYAIRFDYQNINNSKVTFNLDNIDNDGRVFLIYDNSDEEDYQSQTKYPYEFYFNNFDYVYFKYGSDYSLITSDYINRNKFIGTTSTDARIEIENAVESGQMYFISGSFSNFNNVDIYFENFGVNNEMGEYRVFLNDINKLNVYADTNYQSNEKILLVTDNIDDITLYNDDGSEYFDDYRIKIISFEDFMSSGLDKTYLLSGEGELELIDVEDNDLLNSDETNENIESESLIQNIEEVVVENSIPIVMYAFGLILVFFSTFLARKDEKILMVIETKKHMAKHMAFALIPSLIILLFTKNGFMALVLSIAFSSIYSIIYYRNDMTKRTFKKFLIQTIILMIIVGISSYIYNLVA